MFNINNPQVSIGKAFGLIKGGAAQEGEIRTHGGKKMQKKGDKWVPVTENKGAKKKEDTTSKSASKDELRSTHNMSKQEMSKLTQIKSLVDSDPAKAHEIADKLSDEAKEKIPQEAWDKMTSGNSDVDSESDNTSTQNDPANETIDMTSFDSFDSMMNPSYGFNDLMAKGWFDKYDDNIKKFNKDESKALDSYRDTHYKALNNLERGGEKMEKWEAKNPDKAKELRNISNSVSSAISKTTINEDMISYRGIDGSRSEELATFFNDLKVGDTYTDKGFSSTSINKDIVEGKFSATQGKGANLKIIIPKGSKALPMQNVGSKATQQTYDDEFEVLLDKNSQFRVVEKDGVNVTVELIQGDQSLQEKRKLEAVDKLKGALKDLGLESETDRALQTLGIK